MKSKTARRRGEAAALVAKAGRPVGVAAPSKKPPPRRTPAAERTMEGAFLEAGGNAVDSSPAEWKRFWEGRPVAVGVDAEGTHFEPPLLVQIALSDGRTILESPSPELSEDAKRLFADDNIVKVFFGAPEREHLGCPIRNGVDVQRMSLLQTTSPPAEPHRQRGLAAVAGDYLNETLPFVKNKKMQRSFGFVKNRHTNGNRWLTPGARVYSASDAWATLKVYEEINVVNGCSVLRPRSNSTTSTGSNSGKKRKKDSAHGSINLTLELAHGQLDDQNRRRDRAARNKRQEQKQEQEEEKAE